MAKGHNTTNNKATYPYPSQFGSHTSMIDNDATAQLDDSKLVACKDAYGVYITERNRLDDGMNDVNRSDGRRVKDVAMNKLD